MTRSWPALPVWVHGARFSGAAVATSLVLGLHDALPQIVVGRVLGAEATGFFNRAQRIVQLLEEALNTSIKNVALSSLARAQRASIDLGEPFRRKIAYLSAIAWPTFLIIALTADPVIRVLLGREWVTIVPLLQLSCLGGLVLPFTAVNIGFFYCAQPFAATPTFTTRIVGCSGACCCGCSPLWAARCRRIHYSRAIGGSYYYDPILV